MSHFKGELCTGKLTLEDITTPSTKFTNPSTKFMNPFEYLVFEKSHIRHVFKYTNYDSQANMTLSFLIQKIILMGFTIEERRIKIS